nr:MAG TPA: hypothetical protein [Caudoviricetes sp.]
MRQVRLPRSGYPGLGQPQFGQCLRHVLRRKRARRIRNMPLPYMRRVHLASLRAGEDHT